MSLRAITLADVSTARMFRVQVRSGPKKRPTGWLQVTPAYRLPPEWPSGWSTDDPSQISRTVTAACAANSSPLIRSVVASTISWLDYRARLHRNIRKSKSTLHFMEKASAPSLLPVLRSRQQGEVLALLLGDPDLELSLTEISVRIGAPHPSVHREIERAERAGLVRSRKVGNTRLVRADTSSPYYAGLADVLTRAFGVPAVLVAVIGDLAGISEAYVYGSWAARHAGQPGTRPVGDIDLLILGDPDRDRLYEALSQAEKRLGRPVEATIRDAAWLESGSGAFHETVTSRPLFRLDLPHHDGSAS